MRRLLPLLCLLTACSATKGLSDLADGVDCALGCGLGNAVGICGQSGCEIASCNDGFADCNGLPADGCEVDTDADPTNCAFCGNACDTGACLQGSCQDVNVVASPLGDGRDIVDFVVDSSGVYFLLGSGLAPPPEAGTPPGVSLEFVAQAGSEPVSLADFTGSAGRLAEGEERLCVVLRESTSVASSYRLLSLPKTGGDPTLLSRVDVPLTPPHVLEPYVYWLTGGFAAAGTLDPDGGVSVDEWTDQALHRALIGGGTDETLASWTKPDFVSLLAAGSGVVLLAKGTLLEYDGGLLGMTSNGLFSFDPAIRAEVAISKDLPRPQQAVLQDDVVYWVIMGVNAGNTTPSSLESVPLSGGAPATLWTADAATVAEEVAVTDRYFFLTVGLSRAALPGLHAQSQAYFYGILRLDRASGRASLVAKRDAPPTHVVADGEYVYWLEGGQILRARQAGSAS